MRTKKEVRAYLQSKINSPGALAKPQTLIDVLSDFRDEESIKMTAVTDVNRFVKSIFFTVKEGGKDVVVAHLEIPLVDEKSQAYFDKYLQ